MLQAIDASAGGMIVDGGQGIPKIVTAVDADPAALISYRHRYCSLDPVIPLILQAPEGAVLTRDKVIPKSEMIRTEFYADWLRPQHIDDCLVVKLSTGIRAGVLAFAVSAKVMTFSADAVRVMRLLAPHLRLALKTHDYLQGINLQRDDALEALDQLGRAVLVVDEKARVIWMNRAGGILLAEGDGLTGGGEAGLEAATRDQTTCLKRLIAAATRSAGEPSVAGFVALSRPSGGRPLMTLVTPTKRDSISPLLQPAPRALIMVAVAGSASGVSPEALQDLFGFTPAEARIAQLVGQGIGLKAAAGTIGIAPSTAKTHLIRIFAKTGTSRQAELVQLFSRLP
jgi:DNA-binding CsgD family transcriptional regulator